MLEPAPIAHTKRKHDLNVRLRMLAFATGDYCLALFLSWLYALIGAVPYASLAILAGAVVLINLTFFLCFYTGISQRLSDPSMTGSQVGVAVLFNLLSMILMPQMSVAVLIFVFIGMSYGALNMTLSAFFRIWLIYIAGMALALNVSGLQLQVPLATSLERLIFLIAVILTFGRFLWVSAFVSRQRERYRQKKNELAQTAASLQASRQRLAMIVDTLPLGVLVLDDAGKPVLLNKIAKDMARASAAFPNENAAQAIGSAIGSAIGMQCTGTHQPIEAEAQGVTNEATGASGRRFLSRFARLRQTPESAERIVVFWDITELRHAESELERGLAFLTHDLRAPLSAIAARVNNAGIDLNETRDAIAEDLRRCMSLADNFIMLARADHADQSRLRPLMLTEVIEEAMTITEPIAVQNGVHLYTNALKFNVALNGDWTLLLRAIVNLIINAIRFSPAGGVVSVRLYHEETTATARVEVCDSGPGFQPSVISMLEGLSPEFIESREHGSMGLGLLLVKKVAALHKGKLQINNSAESGAIVNFSIATNSVDSRV